MDEKKKKTAPKSPKAKIDTTPKYIPEDQIAAALIARRGKQYVAAQDLGITSSSISERISRSPRLQEIVKQANEVALDIAEINLFELNQEKNLGSICFLLKTKGKSRGYVENNQIDVTPETLANYMALMNQMKELQKKD